MSTLPPVNFPAIVNADALAVPLASGTVSLVVTSPPYWALRVYEDAGEVYDGQIGSESDPVLFLRNLWASMDEAWRYLRDDGVAWVNLGDKYAGSGGHNNAAIGGRRSQTEARDRTRNGERDVAAPGYVRDDRKMAGRETRTCAACGWTGTRTTCRRCGGETTRPVRDGFRSAKAAAARDTARDELHVPAATRASRTKARGTRRQAPDRYEQGTDWARAKSLMALPWAFVLGLLNPALYRDHLDPVPDWECPTCEGRDPADYMDDPPCTVCPTCDGEGVIAGEHPQWIYRAEQVWDKPNGLPESVTDRPRRAHEVWLMLAKNGDHFGALDDLREPYDPNSHPAGPDGAMWRDGPMAATWGVKGSQSIPTGSAGRTAPHPGGKLPGSVWRITSEPFVDVLYHVDTEGGRIIERDDLWPYVARRVAEGDTSPVIVREAEHFAPFPSEWPRRLVLGWSPSAICTVCNRGRFPVTSTELVPIREPYKQKRLGRHDATDDGRRDNGFAGPNKVVGVNEVTLLGYACACTPVTDHGPAGEGWKDEREVARSGKAAKPDGSQNIGKKRRERYEYHLEGWEAPPSRPAVVVDMFGGTGTTAMVAAALDRVAVSVDLSWDYCRLAEWRTRSPKQRARARARTLASRQGTLL